MVDADLNLPRISTMEIEEDCGVALTRGRAYTVLVRSLVANLIRDSNFFVAFSLFLSFFFSSFYILSLFRILVSPRSIHLCSTLSHNDTREREIYERRGEMKYRRSAGEKKEGEEKAFSSMTKRMDLQPGESSERSAREGEKRIAEKRRGIFVRKWHGFPGFGISIRNIGRRWLEGGGTAPRNLEFPLVIKSYPLQSGNTRHCRCCGRRE